MAALATPRTELAESLEKHNATFTKLLSLIPAKFYLPPDQEELDSRFMKNKKRRTGEEIKDHKRKAKAEKLDPANNLTTDQLLARQAEAEAEAGPSTSTPSAGAGAAAGPTSADLPPVQQITPLPPTASITDLRAKLHDRLEQFKRDRGEPETRDELEEERRRKRGEMRDRRRNELKERKKKERQEPTAKGAKTQLIVPQLPKSNPVDADGISYQAVSLPSTSKQNKAPLKALSNPSQALAHLEKHNSKLASLPEEKRKEIEERERWAKAEERARGGKVADEEKTLKKAVKRLEKTKSKSGKEWSERKRDLEHSQQTSIKKRNDNIAMRAQSKRDKKMGVKDKGKKKAGGSSSGPKKHSSKKRPGFEGGKGGKKDKA